MKPKTVSKTKPTVAKKSAKKVARSKRVRQEESPFRLQDILVPIDFSDCSLKALDYAIAFATQFKARIVLLYVVDLPIVASEMGMFIDQPVMENEFRENAEEQLRKVAESKIQSTIPVETLVSCGRAYPEIVETAKQKQTSLIIIGTHGYSGFQHALMGGTTERVVRHAPCPVLVVRERETEFV